jgi:tetratricopeptide (TPR) repeat protein
VLSLDLRDPCPHDSESGPAEHANPIARHRGNVLVSSAGDPSGASLASVRNMADAGHARAAIELIEDLQRSDPPAIAMRARLAYETGDYVGAISIAERAIGAAEHGSDAYVMATRSRLRALSRLGRTVEAMDAARALVAYLKEHRGAYDPAALSAELDLVKLELATGDTEHALVDATEAHAKLVRRLGEKDPRTLVAADRHAAALAASGQVIEAIAMADRTLALWRAGFGDEHPAAIAFRRRRVDLLVACGRAVDALNAVTELVDDARRVMGDRHPDTVAAMMAGARASAAAGAIEKAIDLAHRAREIAHNALRPEQHERQEADALSSRIDAAVKPR